MDVFLLLNEAARQLSHSSLALLAQARAHELAAAGQAPLHPDLRAYIDEYGLPKVWGYSLTETDQASVLDWYARARAKADEWQTEHDAWVRGQLAKGLHPDLDPEAFGEFPRAKLPRLPNGLFGLNRYGQIPVLVVLGILGIVVFVRFGSRTLRWCFRQRSSRAAA